MARRFFIIILIFVIIIMIIIDAIIIIIIIVIAPFAPCAAFSLARWPRDRARGCEGGRDGPGARVGGSTSRPRGRVRGAYYYYSPPE